MARFYLAPEAWHDSPTLVGDEARHLSQVLRMAVGDSVAVFDGLGHQSNAEIVAISRNSVSLKLGSSTVTAPPRPRITMAQSIPKGKNMDWIVQKSVELGVAEIHPLVTRYTVVQPGDGKSDKWQRCALEACKQCGQDTLPVIARPETFEKWIQAASKTAGLKLIASLTDRALPLRQTLRNFPDTTEVTVLIGPEGDFSDDETSQAVLAGFLPVSLGSIVLRVETASFFMLSAIRYEFS